MPRFNFRHILPAFFAFAFTALTLSPLGFGQTESVLYTFTDSADGGLPFGNLIFDSAGNLYGTTDAGGVPSGSGGYGVVFELSPISGGGWSETVLYAFTGDADGQNPFGGVVFDGAGNLYGTTNFGGTHNLGTVFELSPASSGGWTHQVLYSFAGGHDALYPNGGLAIDAAGNLYGASYNGGTYDLGTVFEVSPVSGGGWSESIILNGSTARGRSFATNVALDAAGNLYVSAYAGGSSNAGAIYRLNHTSAGWKSGVIYTFLGGADGSDPGGLILQAPGRLFGVTQSGGTYGFGTAFELTPVSGGTWSKTVLHNFGVSSIDALYPANPFTVGSHGQLYGTTGSGGSFGNGTAYELAKLSGGWKEKMLYNFGVNLGGPAGSIVLDGAGNMYGLSHNGGSFGAGGVFEIVP
jgi:uncharacterized repeat protein (TIGR03803 family)